jgi:hypothetical protein|tara:strand:+ start:549 stop:692 length:144 start_codon:yes stop_codon:yes gene_type:complete
MRVQLDEMIDEIKQRLETCKSIRNRVLLEQALNSLLEFKRLNEKKIV